MAGRRVCAGFVVLFLTLRESWCYSCNRTAQELIKWIKSGQYDNTVRPNVTGGPVIVDVEAYVASIGAIDEKKMEFSVDIFFRQRWREERLCYLPQAGKGSGQRLILNPVLLKNTWRPDVFIKNSKEARFHEVPSDNVMYGISPDGNILLSSRITTTLSCQMNFRRFPMDVQKCHFQTGSYGHTEDDIVIRWRGGKGLIISDEVEISQYSITEVTSRDFKGVYNTGVFSEPIATIVLKRRLMYYVYGYYLPAGLVVFLSWISFWIDPRSVPARVSLGVITILAMGSFLHGGKGPSVSYATALDVYIISCYVFVFTSLLEFSLVHCGMTYCEKQEAKKESQKEAAYAMAFNKQIDQAVVDCNHLANGSALPTTSTESMAVEPSQCQVVKRGASVKVRRVKDTYLRFNADKLESYTRIMFPVAFGIFNVVYWAILYQT